jgi:hypothetical protein
MIDPEKTRLDAFEAFLATMGEKDRRNVKKHIGLCEAEPAADHADLWKRLAMSLANLGGKWVKTTGMRAIQFFVADGTYRIQTFALEDLRDGVLSIYLLDALDAAVGAGILVGPIDTGAEALLFQVGGLPGMNLRVEVLSASRTVDAPDYYKHLLGWNRKALRVSLPINAGRAQVEACEALCALAVRQAAAATLASAARRAEAVTA